jgi:hypothetical protein
VSIFTAELASRTQEYDIPTDPPAVVEAARHLHDFRTGFSELLYRVACDATAYPCGSVGATELLEPPLRILGREGAQRMAERLYRIASDVTRSDRLDGGPDLDEAERTLRVVCERAATDIAAEFHRDSCICRDATKEASR